MVILSNLSMYVALSPICSLMEMQSCKLPIPESSSSQLSTASAIKAISHLQFALELCNWQSKSYSH